MLRASLIALVAVSLAACDDDSETVIEETDAEVEVAVDSAETEIAETAGEAEEALEAAPEATEDVLAGAAEEVGETAEETEQMAEGAAEEVIGEEGDDTTTLTSESPAVETTILTEADTEVVSPEDDEGNELAAAEPDAGEAEEDEGIELAAAEPEGGEAEDDAMQRYQEWALGRWAESASCESGVVEMEENTLSLPGDVTCSEIEVAGMGDDGLAITGSACEGAADLEEVDLEVTQTDDGITVARDGQEANLVRCE